MCSIVHSESKKRFCLKQDPNQGQLELPQMDAKTTEPLSNLAYTIVSKQFKVQQIQLIFDCNQCFPKR